MNKNGPEEIHWVRRGPLSIARLYGGIVFNGQHYIYFPTCPIHGAECDHLIRSDVVRARRLKAAQDAKKAKAEKAKAAPRTGDLFGDD